MDIDYNCPTSPAVVTATATSNTTVTNTTLTNTTTQPVTTPSQAVPGGGIALGRYRDIEIMTHNPTQTYIIPSN